MSGRVGKTTNRPTDVIGTMTTDERESQWGAIDGEIVDYDAAKGTATVKPLYKPLHNGKPVDMPNLLEVPVRFQRGGKGAITFPVQPGDKVRLSPGMRSGENYHADGDGAPSDARSFNLSDMEASLIGGESLNDPLPNVDPNNMHMRFNPDGTYGIRGSADGKIAIEGSEGNIYSLVADAADLAAEGFEKLGTEATLTHMAEYASIGAQLRTIADKLAAMKIA